MRTCAVIDKISAKSILLKEESMKPKLLPILLAALVLLLASLACQALEGGGVSAPAPDVVVEPESPAPDPEPQGEPPTVEAAMPEPVASKGPGLACFGLRSAGITCLDENGWKTYTRANSDLASDFVQAAGACPDGRIAIAHSNGVSLFDGAVWQQIAKSDGYSSVDAISCAEDGTLWVAHFRGVSRYAGGNWQTFSAELLATGEYANELVYNVIPSPDGRVWAVTSRSVAAFENDEWTVYQPGDGFEDNLFFNALTLDSLERPWVGYSNGVAYFEGGAWRQIGKPDFSSPQAMTLDANGRVWLGSTTSGLTFFDGSVWTNYTVNSNHLPTDRVNALAADSMGRIWAGTSYGLVVVDGSTWQTYRMENSDIGDNFIEFIAIINDGPSLPALVEKETGTLTGKLEDAASKPLAGMRVEICVEPLGSQFSGDTPCSEQPFFLSTETDANGIFRFENVPTGYYVFVAETGDGWAQLTTEFGIGSERSLIQPGEDYDIGTLTLEE
jgi:hypothetical protein